MSKSPLGERERIARIIDPYLPWDQPVEAYGWARELRREEALAKADLILSALLPEEGQGLSPSQGQPVSDALRATTSPDEPSASDETAWLIEETWSGFVHYVHQDFDCVKWATECRRDSDRNRMGLRSLMREPVVTKDIDLAMRFPTKDAAEVWLAFQPRWMSQGDQYQIREHMWLTPPATPALGLIEGEQGSSNAISGPTPKSADTEAEPSADTNLLNSALRLQAQVAAVNKYLDMAEAAYLPHEARDNHRGAYAGGVVTTVRDVRKAMFNASPAACESLGVSQDEPVIQSSSTAQEPKSENGEGR